MHHRAHSSSDNTTGGLSDFGKVHICAAYNYNNIMYVIIIIDAVTLGKLANMLLQRSTQICKPFAYRIGFTL